MRIKEKKKKLWSTRETGASENPARTSLDKHGSSSTSGNSRLSFCFQLSKNCGRRRHEMIPVEIKSIRSLLGKPWNGVNVCQFSLRLSKNLFPYLWARVPFTVQFDQKGSWRFEEIRSKRIREIHEVSRKEESQKADRIETKETAEEEARNKRKLAVLWSWTKKYSFRGER